MRWPVNIVFGIIAALMVYGAVRVVTTTNVVHAALWLVVVLAGAGPVHPACRPSSSPSPR
jgi:NADH:ubiquinone oxidoreductase subunit 6 (subunit J)